MLTEDEKTEYMLDVEPVLLRDKWATLLVKLDNGKVLTVKTDVTFFIQDEEIKLWDFENPSEFWIVTSGGLLENTNNNKMVDVVEFVEVDVF